MHHDDLLLRIQQSARQHGPNEARRALRATMRALRGRVPEDLFVAMIAGLPEEIGARLTCPAVGGALGRSDLTLKAHVGG